MFSYSLDPVEHEAHTYRWKHFTRSNFDTLKGHICKHVWSGILWQPGVRKAENFYACAYAVLDFDDGLTIEDCIAAFADCPLLIGTTKSHGLEKISKSGGITRPACDRYRAVIPLAKPIWSRDVYEYNIKKLVAGYGADSLSASASMRWMPCKEIVYCNTEGTKLEVITDIPEDQTTAYKQKARQKYVNGHIKNKTMPGYVLDCIQGRVAPGHRNGELFRSAAFLFDAGKTADEVITILSNIPFFHEADGMTAVRSAASKSGLKI